MGISIYEIGANRDKLLNLGFRMEELEVLKDVLINYGKVNSSVLSSLGFSYKDVKRLQYLHDMITGKATIDTGDAEAVSKHFKRMYGENNRIGIGHLPLSKFNKVPRLAVIAGIPDGSYSIYNSSNDKEGIRMYPVIGLSDKKVMIQTRRKPILTYGSEKKLYYIKNKTNEKIYYTEDSKKINRELNESSRAEIGTVLEIKKLTEDKKVVVAVDKRYTRMVNRYMIIASFREPQFHLGLYKFVAFEGTMIYLYVEVMKESENVQYNRSTQRVYDFGFDKGQIQAKLEKTAKELYTYLKGVYCEFIPATMEYEPYYKKESNPMKEIAKKKVEF
ncbi:hypothetical protein [Anaerocolumna sp.]|uniref:hypothetical protein n=1 Tax=Anaerocolumna sp. TaxID=2041569 RepID=UPI0028AA3BC3|nr:hypothetical protein [Anaerocolumna sp.]